MPETTSDTVVKKKFRSDRYDRFGIFAYPVLLRASWKEEGGRSCASFQIPSAPHPTMEIVLAELLDQSDPHPVPLRLFIHRLLTKQRHTRTHPVGTTALFPAENDKAPDQSVRHPVTEFLWM